MGYPFVSPQPGGHGCPSDFSAGARPRLGTAPHVRDVSVNRFRIFNVRHNFARLDVFDHSVWRFISTVNSVMNTVERANYVV